MTVKSNDITTQIVEGLQDKKAKRITIVNLDGIAGASTGKFIICQGTSTSHVTAIADNVREYVQQHTGRKPYNYDGYRSSQWIVIDYGEIMVHIFLPDIREIYNLEELWGDAKIEEIEDLD